ncbi:MAG: TolA-binding protein [Myxococcota bacterium]|jgi:TolA-binding protein
MQSLLSILILSSLAGAQTAERVEGPIPEEVAAFRSAHERFLARMTEIDDDTRVFVGQRERAERARLVEGYDALLGSLRDVERGQRDVAVERFERFLGDYGDDVYASHVRFRLADLYFEVSSEQFFAESREYYLKAESDDIEVLEGLGPEPKLDLSRPIALYDRIIADNAAVPKSKRYERLDGVYLMLGFCLTDETSAQRDETRARQVFAELIEVAPESELADRSHLFLGNFMFADGENDQAIAEYGKVVEKGESSPYFTQAVYQMAWSRYRLNQYDEALALFVQLLDLSEAYRQGRGKQSPFAPDAKKFMAYSFADIAAVEDVDAVDIATRFFGEVGARPYERDIYLELPEVLLRYSRPAEAIGAYQKLQFDPRWVNKADNPDHHMAVVRLYSTNFLVRNLQESGAERLRLTELYGEGSPWWNANRNNPDALQRARDYIESSLLDVAIEYFVRAQESGDSQEYAIAAVKYRDYLDKFPISDDYYQQQWFLATALRLSGQWEAAAAEYNSLIRSDRYHDFDDGARYSLMDVRLQQMLTQSGPPGEPAASPVVESSYEPAPGTSIEVYALTKDRAEFIAAVDVLVDHTFAEQPAADMPDYAASFENDRSKLVYIPGQILFYHNRYEEARPRFLKLIEEMPRTEEASFAASLLLDSYIAENDLASVRKWSKNFATMSLGPADTVDSYFADTLEGSTFKLALQAAEAGDNIGAAEAFLAFKSEFPRSEYAPDALYNAAYYYQQVGKVDQANQLYEKFVAEYPDNDKSRVLLFNIAANYEATFQLERAIGFYRQLVDLFPSDVNAADAVYNAAFLQLGLEEYEGAALGFETYASNYDRPDEEEVMFMAGEAWEKVSPDRALRFWQKYLDDYGNTNPDRALDAEGRIASLHAELGNVAAAEARQDAIVARFDAIVGAGGVVGARGQHSAARAEFRVLQVMFDDLVDDQLTGDEEKDGVLLDETKPAEIKALGSRADAFIAKYADFAYISAAYLLKAEALLYLADLGLSIKPPADWPDEQQFAYLDLLDEKVFPKYYGFEEQGIKRLVELVQFATRTKRHSRYIDDANAELNRRRPADYPALKREIVGKAVPVSPVPIRPLRVPAKADGAGGQ